MKRHTHLVAIILLFLTPPVRADSDTWLTNPADNNWNNSSNWSLGRVPGGSDAAIFADSAITDVFISGASSVGSITFQSDAKAYTITAMSDVEFPFEMFLENDSPLPQNFVSTADATFSSGFNFSDGAFIAGPITFTQQGAAVAGGQVGYVNFFGSQTTASAGTATFHNLGGSVAGGGGGQTNFFYNKASAANATIICDGATIAGAAGGLSAFAINSPDAGNATLIANGGSNGGGGGFFLFEESALAETARLEVFGNSYMDCSGHNVPSFSIGSIEGDGQIYLGSIVLIVGSNSLDTTFSGVLHPGDPSGGGGSGGLTKNGLGTLTLTGANLYTAGTTITRGQLIVSNTAGSGTGTGPVNVNGGTLGGSGIIAGSVTVGTGGGAAAFLAPAYGGDKQLTLTIQDSLTFNSKGTYTYTFKAKANKSKIDKVIANGVTINSGASINLSGTTQGHLTQGTALTLLKNTAATPITGTFSNLPDGAIVNVNANNLQASYEGGDGNDLTLTVVP